MRDKQKKTIMEKINKDVKKLIDGHIQKINDEKKDLIFKLDPNLPDKIKKEDQDIIERAIITLEDLYSLLFPFVKNIKRDCIKDVAEKTLTCGIYLLLCHVFETWKVVFLLARSGMNTQMMNLIRHIKETLDLVEFFIIKGEGSQDFKKWFDGEVVSPKKSRKAIEAFLESDPTLKNEIDFYNMQSYIYALMSIYTHSGYCAMLESVDVFNKDFDFKKYSSFHFVKGAIKNTNEIMNSTMITMKSVFLYLKNMRNYQQIDTILKRQLPQLDKKNLEDFKEKFPKN